MRKIVASSLFVVLGLLVGSSFAADLASPRIVKSVTLLGLSGALPEITLLTFDSNLYRVNIYYEMVHTTRDCNSAIAPIFQWTDDSGHLRAKRIGNFLCFKERYKQEVFVVHGVHGTPLSFLLEATPQDTILYNLYITVEQLQ